MQPFFYINNSVNNRQHRAKLRPEKIPQSILNPERWDTEGERPLGPVIRLALAILPQTSPSFPPLGSSGAKSGLPAGGN